MFLCLFLSSGNELPPLLLRDDETAQRAVAIRAAQVLCTQVCSPLLKVLFTILCSVLFYGDLHISVIVTVRKKVRIKIDFVFFLLG